MTRQNKEREQVADFLAQLVLWRHDPELTQTIARLAAAGQRDAQYALGLLYAEGRGLEQDEVAAYAWLTRAMAQGDTDAAVLREVVAQHMSLEQIRLAENRFAGRMAN